MSAHRDVRILVAVTLFAGCGGPGAAKGVDARTPDTTIAVDAGVDAGPSLRVLAGQLGGPGSVDGIGTAARLSGPMGLASDGLGNVYVADADNYTIRKVELATGAVSTLAGMPGVSGSDDGTGAAARFGDPVAVASDGAGNLFVVDAGNQTIREVVVATGVVTTLAGTTGVAGSVDATGTAARFDGPVGVASDGAGNLYVADSNNDTIRKVVIATGAVTTLAGMPGMSGSADGTGATARFSFPAGLASDAAGNLYVAEFTNDTIRKVAIATGAVTTLAGTAGMVGSSDGIGASARFKHPDALVSDTAGNLFVIDSRNHTIRTLVIATGAVTTLAGTAGLEGSTDGTGASARFSYPSGIARDGAGNLYVADHGNSTIRKVAIASGAVTTPFGAPSMPGSSDGTGSAARFDLPYGAASDGDGNLYVVDQGNNTIRSVATATGAVTTLAGMAGASGSTDATGSAARFSEPSGVATDGAGNLYVGDSRNQTIRKIAIATGVVTTVAGMAGVAGSADGIGAAARFSNPNGLACDGAGNLYVADVENYTIRKVVIATGAVITLAGTAGVSGSVDGTGAAARFTYPLWVASDAMGGLYVADNHTIRRIVIATGAVTTVAGMAGSSGSQDGIGAAARFADPLGMVSDGANLYVADPRDGTIRKLVIATGAVTTPIGIAGHLGVVPGPLPATLNTPAALAISGADLAIVDGTENAVLIVGKP